MVRQVREGRGGEMIADGLDSLIAQDFAPLRGKRVGLVTHQAALAKDGRSAAEVFASTDAFKLVALFGPEHGISGTAQDLIAVADEEQDSLLVHSLYGQSFESLKPTPAMLRGLDVLVIALVDVGARYYTFQATMLYCMEACSELGLPVVVLDMPNPIGFLDVEGPALQPGFESFVGCHPISAVHGMTMGELAKLYHFEKLLANELTVIALEGYTRKDFTAWGLPPSPNMPNMPTASVYPGMCLFEGTNLSEGRGTTTPFEYIGHPAINPRVLAASLRAKGVPDVCFAAATFRPTFHKFAGQDCHGVFTRMDGEGFRPVRTGLAVLIAFRDLLGDKFQWRTETYEFVSHTPAIDLLFGSDRERTMIEAGARWQEIAKLWEPEEAAFRERRKPFLLY